MKIRLTTFARNDENLRLRFIERYCGGSAHWRDLEFVSDDSFDWLIIFTSPHQDTKDYDEGKAITLLTEPPSSPNRRSHKTSRIEKMYLPLPFLPSTIYGSAKFGGNEEIIKKNKLLSIVTSDLSYLKGHQARLQFVYSLDRVVLEGLDIWGKSQQSSFFKYIRNYHGPIVDKYEALWKYKYHFACENSFERNYFTEKIADPIIAESLCFYDGCKNLYEFIDERAFIKINVKKQRESIETIIVAIENNEWRRRIRYIREQKKRLLNELHPLNIIWLTVHQKDVLKECRL
ncbi:hypothetical protein H7F33_11680 [Pedobacter sp. PAMC26386]|nr:hypothetical protein H7F33_11680 [Pedobacter sp. PAMC26386]